MLDRDLAELYGVELKRLNEQVKRNRDRFPEDFMFQLTLEEGRAVMLLRSQVATLKRGAHLKYQLYVVQRARRSDAGERAQESRRGPRQHPGCAALVNLRRMLATNARDQCRAPQESRCR
jgi:hypothetical protein